MLGFFHSSAVLFAFQKAKEFKKNTIYYTDGKAAKQSSTEESNTAQGCFVNKKVIMSH